MFCVSLDIKLCSLTRRQWQVVINNSSGCKGDKACGILCQQCTGCYFMSAIAFMTVSRI